MLTKNYMYLQWGLELLSLNPQFDSGWEQSVYSSDVLVTAVFVLKIFKMNYYLCHQT